MVVVKKSNESGGAPSLDILAAKLRIVEAKYIDEPYEVNLDNGRSFEADPNVNIRVEVLKNLVEPGKDEAECEAAGNGRESRDVHDHAQRLSSQLLHITRSGDTILLPSVPNLGETSDAEGSPSRRDSGHLRRWLERVVIEN